MQTITIEQAIAEGYEYWVYGNNDGEPIQSLSDLQQDPESSDWELGLYLVDKEKRRAVSTSAADLKEEITEQLCCRYYDATGNDDDSEVEDAMKAIDFRPIAEAINEALKDIYCYAITEIKLIKPD